MVSEAGGVRLQQLRHERSQSISLLSCLHIMIMRRKGESPIWKTLRRWFFSITLETVAQADL